MLDAVFIPATNRLLRRNSWALQRLQACAGKTARIESPPFGVSFAVLDNGELAAAAPGATPDATMTFSPGVMLRVLAR